MPSFIHSIPERHKISSPTSYVPQQAAPPPAPPGPPLSQQQQRKAPPVAETPPGAGVRAAQRRSGALPLSRLQDEDFCRTHVATAWHIPHGHSTHAISAHGGVTGFPTLPTHSSLTKAGVVALVAVPKPGFEHEMS